MRKHPAFSIIELLVAIGIVAILIAILLPAIGKARDQAYITKSQSNLRQLAIAHATYAAEYNDQQWTNIPHDLTQYGSTLASAFQAMAKTGRFEGSDQWTSKDGGMWYTIFGYGTYQSSFAGKGIYGMGSNDGAPPINMSGGFPHWGSFRMINVRSFNQYIDGRFYDPIFYAPKDKLVIEAMRHCWDWPEEFCIIHESAPVPSPMSPTPRTSVLFSSYVLSPAAMFNPEVFSIEGSFTASDIWNMPAAFRSPTFSQAKYPNLKTHMLEHHWLQRPAQPSNPSVPSQTSSMGREPYYFNAGLESAPVTLFYDGSIRLLSQSEVLDADAKAKAASPTKTGLWHTGTPLAPTSGSTNHYRHEWAYTPPGQPTYRPSSYHILTRDGILGRDTLVR